MRNSHSSCTKHTTFLSFILSEPNLDKEGLLYLKAKIMQAGSNTIAVYFFLLLRYGLKLIIFNLISHAI